MRQANIFLYKKLVGCLIEDENGYHFSYNQEYLNGDNPLAISQLFPLQAEPFKSKTLFSFFDGLIPEGWLLDIAQDNWKLNANDRMGLLLACCRDCIGAVSVMEVNNE